MTRNEIQVNHCTFSVNNGQIIMKDFDDMSVEEREEMLEQIRNLPVESIDPFDLFTQSFNELSNNWSTALKELDTIYMDFEKDSGANLLDKFDKNNSIGSRIKGRL